MLTKQPRPLLIVCASLVFAMQAVGQNTCRIGTNFTRPAWKADNEMFQNRKNVTGDNPWNPQFVEDCRIYACIRTMDADHINGSSRTTWSQRPKKTDANQSPIAYEWFIDMCNRIDADLWVTVPHLTVSSATADNPSDYALRLAILVKTGVSTDGVDLVALGDLRTKSAQDFVDAGGRRTGAPLDADLNVYIEYSNETWNTQFGQNAYCIAQGKALALDTDETRAGYKFHAWAALRLFRAFDLVFGEGSPRVKRVYAGWVHQMLTSACHFMVQDDATLNPWGIQAGAIALAPYVGPRDATSLADVRAEMEKVENAVVAAASRAAQRNVELIAYEAGQHVVSNCIALNSSPEMYDLYIDYLSMLAPHFSLVAHFSQVGIWGGSGCWGAKRYTSQTLAEAHKYRALVDWVQSNPVSNFPATTPKPLSMPHRPSRTAVEYYALNGARLDERCSRPHGKRVRIMRTADGRSELVLFSSGGASATPHATPPR